MHEDLPSYSKLVVVSDTGVYQKDGHFFGFGPVVRELKELCFFENITWICYNRPDQIENKSYVKIDDDRIKIVPLKKTGGQGVINKLSILYQYPKYFSVILKEISTSKYIHSRAPSNPAVMAMFISLFFPNKKFWFKYAGDWKGRASYFYNQQRKWLKRLRNNSIVTVNGTWTNQPQNIIGFENPCLDENDRSLGKISVDNKTSLQVINYCFVGGLNENKGCLLLLEALNTMSIPSQLGVLHIVGDGLLRENLEDMSHKINLPIIFHGTLSKEDVIKIYINSHFIVLPSQSEGFPKVIAEAMNYGCVPIVSNVSCINQYIEHNRNGILIESIDSEGVRENLELSFKILEYEYLKIIKYNYALAEKFTYINYKKQIITRIFN